MFQIKPTNYSGAHYLEALKKKKKMSEVEEVKTDPATKQEEVKEEAKKPEAAAPANGDAKESQNGLSAQLEEKIIRQVEVETDHVVD